MSPDLKQKLKKALAGKAAVEMGQFQFINLDEIRQRAGDEWPEIRAKTYEVSSHFIEKRLDDDDVMIRCQGGFLIIFSQMGGVEAEAHVQEISEELNEFFLGERWLEKLKISADARRVPTDEFLSIVARTQVEDEAADAPAEEPEEAEEAAREAARSWEKSSAESGPKGAKGGRWEKTTHSAPKGAPGGGLEWPEEAFAERAWDEIVFRPVWDAHSSTLLHNTCTVMRRVGDRKVYGRDTLMGTDLGPQLRELDREVALAAQRGFQALYSEGGPGSVVIPVHYETLSTVSHRLDYFAILQAVPKHIRRFFQLRVDSIPDGAPLGQMQEVFRSMRHFGSNIIAELNFSRQWDLKRFESCGVSVFATGLPPRMAASEPKDEAVVGLMNLIEAAKAHRSDVELDAIANAEYLNAGVSVGVRYFSGPEIAIDCQQPIPATALSAGDIINRGPYGQDVEYI